jgi:hypothetical protein
MTHLPKFHDRPNIFMPKVSSFIGILEEFFNEDYLDADKIQTASFQMQGKVKDWWAQIKERPKGVTTWAKFRRVFMEQYLPQDDVHPMKLGFMGLT